MTTLQEVIKLAQVIGLVIVAIGLAVFLVCTVERIIEIIKK